MTKLPIDARFAVKQEKKITRNTDFYEPFVIDYQELDGYRKFVLFLSFDSSVHNYGPDSFEEDCQIFKVLNDSISWMVGTTMHIGTPDHKTVYATVELHEVVAEGEILKTFSSDGFSHGILVGSAEAIEASPVRFLNSEDLREPGTEQCPELVNELDEYEGSITSVCGRQAGHFGDHLQIGLGSTILWSKTHLSHDNYQPFGIPVECPVCGLAGIQDEKRGAICFKCNFWLECKDIDEGIVVEGCHYLPWIGGFGGKKFTVQFFADEKLDWTGELLTQGEIPEYFRDSFPDNAKFAE